MTREGHARFCEGLEVKSLRPTHPLIAIIGKHWLTVTDEEGHRRLDNTEDFVRIEIKAALKRDIPVIPFLVGGARMPKSVSFPKVLMK